MIFCLFGVCDDQIFCFVNMGNFFDGKRLLPGRLNGDIAIFQKCGNHIRYLYGDILHVFQTELRYFSAKKTPLIDIDNALGGDDPFIKVKINPYDKRRK